VHLTSSLFTHQQQTNQLAASIMGASMTTAAVLPSRGTKDANGPEDKAYNEDYDRVEPARLGRQKHLTKALVNGCVLPGRLSLEDFIAFGELDPGLLPASPYVPGGPQPGCIIQRAATDADNAIPRRPAHPGAALRAN
jgi:hypothetical protein